MVSKIIQRLKRASGAELKRGDLPFKIESDPKYQSLTPNIMQISCAR